MTQDQFLELLSTWIRTNKQTSESFQITLDTELLGSGLLDSFDFLDLIVHIESKTGRKIDLAVADPNEFSVVRGLWSLAINGEGPAQGQRDRKSTLPADAGITR
jgi:acyl carrier protein